jgi:hypothetical protein
LAWSGAPAGENQVERATAHGDENQEKQRRASGGLGTGGGVNPSAKTLHTMARRREKTLGKNGDWLRDEDTAGELKRKSNPGRI